jgi:protein-S-isoprenylcysteine O-methyltransferase Ste14
LANRIPFAGNKDARNREKGMHPSLTRIFYHHRLGQAAGALFFLFWIGQRAAFNPQRTWLWWLITIQYCFFVLAYLVRRPAREHARGWAEVVFPFVCAALPFALDAWPFKPPGRLAVHPGIALGLMALGTLLITAGVVSLKHSFSIMAEVREVRMEGIYRWTRHPMYLGSLVSTLGVLLAGYNRLNLSIYLVFIVLQVVRAGIEERKIAAVFPEYGPYAAQVGWAWGWGRRNDLPGKG